MEKLIDIVTSKAFLWLLGLALVVAGTIVVIARNRDDKLVDTGKEAGAAGAVIAGHETTLTQLGDANHAEQSLHAGGERSLERFRQCVLDSDRPDGCERFRPTDD